MDPNLPVSSLPSVGPSYAEKLKKIGVETIRDLIYHIPYRYQDFSIISKIESLQPGEKATIQGQIIAITNIFTKYGKKIQKATISDGNGTIEATWFNQMYLVKNLPVGTFVSLSGKVQAFGRKKTLISPQYEKITNSKYQIENSPTGQTLHTGRLVPIYPETSGLSSKWLRSRIAHVLPLAVAKLEDPLPDSILQKRGLLSLSEALSKIHLPGSFEDAEKGRSRLAFDEMLELQIRSMLRKKDWQDKKLAHSLKVTKEDVLKFTKALPFTLTASQKQAMAEITKDMEKPTPMNRLLQGDVGSGKTVVAALACYIAGVNGFQSAVMAPTQILATQHFKTLESTLKPLGVNIKLVMSGIRKTTNDVVGARTLQTTNVFVGTHALVHKVLKGDAFEKLAVAIIDEQHRFGVRQRAILGAGGAKDAMPHVLTMTATPIPRTVALTIYQDLALSTLDEMPTGRLPIKTWVVPPQKREKAYEWIREKVKNTDEQAFIVCPLIEQSEAETLKSVRAASTEFAKLKKEIFPDLKLELLHGKIKGAERDRIMDKLRKGKIDILVATPVVEVGIDIPTATIMMIEASERFGLAQLHQLRGRVGRGKKQSYCLLFTESSSSQTQTRLKALEKHTSGSKLAEIDLEIRGPGELYGFSQHGYPELKIASYTDTATIKKARETAEILLKDYPERFLHLLSEDQVAVN